MKKNKFKLVFEKGNVYFSKYLVAYILRDDGIEDDYDLGIIVSKKVGNSVVRHRYTRLIREAFRLNKKEMDEKLSIILIAKRNILEKSYKEIEEDFFRLIYKYRKTKRR